MTVRMVVYYAHSIALYNTKQEQRDVETLEALGFEVVNPNAPEHDVGYKREGMAYFQGIIRACDALAFRGNPDGSVNAGVILEIKYAQEHFGMPVFELPSGLFRRGLSVDETRALLREQGAR